MIVTQQYEKTPKETMTPENTMKVVCGTDFSQFAAEAATVAALCAVKTQGQLTLVHVREQPELAAGAPGGPRSAGAGADRSQARLTAEATRLRKLGAVVQEELLGGSAHVALTDFARQSGADLIVVSSLGCVTPLRFLIGSVAERTAQAATVPTLVVRDGKPFRAWLQNDRPLRVLVGCDFSAASDEALRWVGRLNKIRPCHVTVAHISWPPEEAARFGPGDGGATIANATDVQRILERELREKCHQHLGKTKARVVARAAWNEVPLELLALAKAERADLIAVGTRQLRGLKRFYLGSVSREAVYHAPVSVACVPVPLAPTQSPGGLQLSRRVLVPTDLTKIGNRAIPFAYSALRRGGEVKLVHVVRPTSPLSDVARRELADRLSRLVPDGAAQQGIATHFEIVAHRWPATAIAQAAERFRADFICMASQGRTALTKRLLGSIAQAVLAQSRRPVMLIHPSSN